jgi:MFS family permease
MTYAADAKLRPAANTDYRAPSQPRRRGILLALVGLVIALVAFFGNLAAAGQSGTEQASTLAWTFGVTTTGFAVIKTAIAVVLWGILAKLWLRADSIKAVLPKLVGTPGVDTTPEGEIDSPYGKVTVTAKAPEQLPIHKMAKRMFRPMLGMGLMLVVVGLVVSFVWAGTASNTAAAAWTQGLQFLGEGMLLAGIGFLLGTILWAIRTAGGEVQEQLGVKVYTPKMAATAKAFVALMMIGLMAAIAQFIGYVAVAGSASPAAAFAWLGPLREVALGLILAGIALALVTIGNVLAYQFDRIQQLIRSGQRS